MIVKNLDTPTPLNARAAAGHQAEREMAFYLRRALKDSPDLLVFNGLRFVFGEDVAQIDHLVLHKYGVILLESKSVTAKVEVNERGEWTRWYGETVQGMPSPVLQARRQAEFLKKYLNAHADDLLGKILGLQKRFGGMETDVLVAISDSGIIVRPRNGAAVLAEVLKADQVVDQVKAIYARHRKANSLSSWLTAKEGGYAWSDEELGRVRTFLLDRHRPSPAGTLPAEAAPAGSEGITLRPASDPPSAPPASGAVCAICGAGVTDKVFKFCRDHPDRFGGRILCFRHQRQ